MSLLLGIDQNALVSKQKAGFPLKGKFDRQPPLESAANEVNSLAIRFGVDVNSEPRVSGVVFNPW